MSCELIGGIAFAGLVVIAFFCIKRDFKVIDEEHEREKASLDAQRGYMKKLLK